MQLFLILTEDSILDIKTGWYTVFGWTFLEKDKNLLA